MKKLKNLILLALVLNGCNLLANEFNQPFETRDIENIQQQPKRPKPRMGDYIREKELRHDKLAYMKGEDTPYTGMFSIRKGDEVLYTETYKNGKLEGDMTWYDSTGRIVMIETYKNGKIDGDQLTYYPNGKIRSDITYSMGTIVASEWLDQNGDLLFKADYSKGSGDWKMFWDDGKLREQGKYKNFQKDGLWIEYDEAGLLERTIQYSNGRILEYEWHN